MTRRRSGRTLACLLLAGTAVTSACATLRRSPPQLVVELIGAEDLNLVSGRATSVRVRVYQLAAASEFQSMPDPATLWSSGAARVGAEAIAQRDTTLLPNGVDTVRFELTPQTRFVGVAANFYRPDTSRWRAVVPVQPGRSRRLVVYVGARTLTVRPQ